MLHSHIYSPVSNFRLEDQNESLKGYAAPLRGSPCLLKLSSENMPIYYARATGYSDLAANEGFRGGWCGFEAHGLRQAFAVGDTVQLSCAVSEKVLAKIVMSEDLILSAAPSSRTLSVLEMLAHIRKTESCPSIGHLLPFAVNHYRRHGSRSFVEATCQTLLDQWPDDRTPTPKTKHKTDDENILAYLKKVMSKDEYREKWGQQIPGPFHTAFRYDRMGLL